MAYNRYIKELQGLISRRYAPDADHMTTTEWLEKNTTLKGRPFSIQRYPYQRAMLDDDHRDTVVVKPSQTGISEIYQRKAAAFLTRHRNTKLIYSYPGDDMRKHNSQTRVTPMIEGNRVFNLDFDGGKPVRSIDLIQIGTSFMYMTGSKPGDATSIDADAVYLDEMDLHDQANAALFSSRLQNSEHKIKKAFSTPTFTQFGVSGLYDISDQHSFMVRCDSCNHWQFPMFTPEFIHIPNLPSDINSLTEIDQPMIDAYGMDIENAYVCCERCRAPLDLGRENNRAWVPAYPSRKDLRGWKINPFSTSTRPVKDIIKELKTYKRLDFMRGFHNTVLGEPEDSSNARLSVEDIQTCMAMGHGKEVRTPDKRKPAWIGGDMGHICHIVVGYAYALEKPDVAEMIAVPIAKLLETVKRIDEQYTLVGGMIDRHPESQAAADVRDITGGRVLPCEYRGTKDLNIIKDAEGTITHCQADRTGLLDEVSKAIKYHRMALSGYGPLQTEVVSHLRNMIRKEEPEVPATWEKLDAADHFFHALGFMMAGIKLKRLQDAAVEHPQTSLGVRGVDSSMTTTKHLIGWKPGKNQGNVFGKRNSNWFGV